MDAKTTVTNEVIIRDLSNREFLERYAKAGCVGLGGGTTLVDLAIRRGERHLDETAQWSLWSHAFFFQGRRADGHHWVIESDLEAHRKHVRLGVQENRVSKFHDDKFYSALAVLDFGLTPAQVESMLSEGLELVANHERYSIREIFGALMGLRQPGLRAGKNPLAREHSLFCSALVRQVFMSAGVDLVPGVGAKHTTPEDLARTPVPHIKYILRRETPPGKIAAARQKLSAVRQKATGLRRKIRRRTHLQA
jgi:hypothetical protein